MLCSYMSNWFQQVKGYYKQDIVTKYVHLKKIILHVSRIFMYVFHLKLKRTSGLASFSDGMFNPTLSSFASSILESVVLE